MRYKRLKLIGLLLFGIGLAGMQAQTMYVREGGGTQTAYPILSLRKITFSGGNATVEKTDNSTDIYSLSGLRYLNFTDLTTGMLQPNVQLGHSSMRAYPNPVSDLLNIDLGGVKIEGIISIMTLGGKVIRTQIATGESTIILNISDLPQGAYLCRFVNGLEIKTVKIIKQ